MRSLSRALRPALLFALALSAAACDENGDGGSLGPQPIVSRVVVQPEVDTIFARDSLLATDAVQLNATVIGFSGAVVTEARVRWSTADTGIVSVDTAGVVRPRRIGTATVTASSGGKEDQATVVVVWATQRLVLTSPSATPSPTGVVSTADTIFVRDPITASDTRTLRATALGLGGETLTGVRVQWTSSNPSVATVDSAGTVRARGIGTTTITARGADLTATRTVTVASIVREVRVTVPRNQALVGDTLRVTAALAGWSGQAVPTGVPIRFTSSDPSIATVDSTTGLVRFLRVGTVRFTATAAFATGTTSTDITVVEPTFLSVAAGWEHTCGVVVGGRMHCWGRGREGQLGVAQLDTVCFNMEEREEEDNKYPCSLTPKRTSTTVTFPRVVAAGAAFTCGVAGTGRAYCWGDDTLGQLGDGKLTSTNVPRLVTAAVSFTDLTAGGAHGCGLTSVGTAFCWGFDRYGQLGNEQYLYNSSTPISVDGEIRFRSISAGFFHTCGATTDGRAFCWGANNFGQIANARITRIVLDSIKTSALGADTTVIIDSVAVTETPQQISLPAGIQSVVASRGGHSCALGADGTAYCWGSNGAGELGLGTSTPPNRTPQTVQTALRFTQLAAGSGFTCGHSGDAIYCWGRNDLGQLGARGTSLTPRQIGQPVSIDPATGVATAQNVQFVGVTAGTRHACGLTRTGAVYCWGSDYLGALGAGQQALVQYRPVLVRVPPEFADQP